MQTERRFRILKTLALVAALAAISGNARAETHDVWRSKPDGSSAVFTKVTYGDLCAWDRRHKLVTVVRNNVYVRNPFTRGRGGHVARFAPEAVDAPLEKDTELVLLGVTEVFGEWSELTLEHDQAMSQGGNSARPLDPPAPSPSMTAVLVYIGILLALIAAVFLGRATNRRSITYTYQPDVATAHADAEFSARLRDATISLEKYRDRLKGR